MATRGRKPTPTAIKVLEGNPGKRPMNDQEPKPVKKAPACPKWLDAEARKEWRRLAKKLEALGVLTDLDMGVFATYCNAYARWKEADEFISQHGTVVRMPSGYLQQLPQVSIAQTYSQPSALSCSVCGCCSQAVPVTWFSMLSSAASHRWRLRRLCPASTSSDCLAVFRPVCEAVSICPFTCSVLFAMQVCLPVVWCCTGRSPSACSLLRLR